MSSPARPAAQQNGSPESGHSESPNLHAIKEAFRESVDEGFEAGLEALLRLAHEDCEFRPYIAADRVLRGHGEIRGYYREAIAAGTEMRLKPSSFRERGDEVVVDGSLRVARPAGGFSESQISWTYRFRDGRLAEAGWSPRRLR
jgi:ketosteroid isomerase-like protein